MRNPDHRALQGSAPGARVEHRLRAHSTCDRSRVGIAGTPARRRATAPSRARDSRACRVARRGAARAAIYDVAARVLAARSHAECGVGPACARCGCPPTASAAIERHVAVRPSSGCEPHGSDARGRRPDSDATTRARRKCSGWRGSDQRCIGRIASPLSSCDRCDADRRGSASRPSTSVRRQTRSSRVASTRGPGPAPTPWLTIALRCRPRSRRQRRPS